MEARSRGRWGEHLEEVKRYERIGRRVPGNTGPIGTDSSGAQILVAAGREASTWQVVAPVNQNGTKEWSRGDTGPATGEGKPLKAKAQGRYRHETRLERSRVESKRQEVEKT